MRVPDLSEGYGGWLGKVPRGIADIARNRPNRPNLLMWSGDFGDFGDPGDFGGCGDLTQSR